MPNGERIQSTHVGEIAIGPHSARTAHVFPTLRGSLLSIGTFVDEGCRVEFDKTTVRVYDSPDQGGNLILTGRRAENTHKLWMIDLQANDVLATPSTEQPEITDPQNLAAAVTVNDTSAQRVQWIHRTFGSPVPSTFITAWDKGWIRAPGINSRQIKKYQHLLHSTEWAEGHLDQTRKNANSTTRQHEQRHTTSQGDDQEALQATQVVASMMTARPTETNHMDATGRFPVTSNRGKQYVLIMYSENGNYIKPITMKDRTKQSYLAAYRQGLQYFERRGLKPTFQRLDN